MASKFAPKIRGAFAPSVIATEIDPGPTVSGNVKGSNARPKISSVSISRCALPRSSSSFCFNSAHPVEITISPPPTCTTGSEIPKNASTCVPVKNDAISKIKLFIAMRCASCRRAGVVYSRVSARNTGLPPSGFTTGNNALTTKIVVLTVSSKSPPAPRFLVAVYLNRSQIEAQDRAEPEVTLSSPTAPALLQLHTNPTLRSQRNAPQRLDALPRHHPHSKTLRNRRQQQRGLHHRKTRPDTNARPAAKRKIRKPRQLCRRLLAPPVRIEPLRIHKPSRIPLRHPLAHHQI